MADLQPTDVLLVNRGGVDYSILQSDVMADVLDTDLLLVNRGGVDYQATYADVKKGFGPQKIDPAPGDWTFDPAIDGGTGTQVDPFIITPETVNAPGGTVESAQTLTLTGLTPNDLVEWTDLSTGTGDRFKQDLVLIPASGQVDLKLKYLDTPASTVAATFTGDLQIGTSYFRWVVTQNVVVAPVIGSVVLTDSPEADRFTSGTFATTVTMTDDGVPASTKGLKAWVEGVLKTSPMTSAITAVGTIPLAIAHGQLPAASTPLPGTGVSVTDIPGIPGNAFSTYFDAGSVLSSVDWGNIDITFTHAPTGDPGTISNWAFFWSSDATNWARFGSGSLSGSGATSTTVNLSFAPGAGARYVAAIGYGSNVTASSTMFYEQSAGTPTLTLVGTGPTQLTFATDQDLANFAAGDVVHQDSAGIAATPGPWTEGFYTASGYSASFNSSIPVATIQSGTTWTVASGNTADVLRIDTLQLGNYSLSLVKTGGNDLYITTTDDPTTEISTNDPSPTTWHLIGNNVTSFTISNGADASSSTQKRYISISGGGSGGTTFTITGLVTPVPVGTVDSTDVAAKTMTLATSSGTWSANTGNYVIGPLKTVVTKPESDVITAVATSPVYSRNLTSPSGWSGVKTAEKAFDDSVFIDYENVAQTATVNDTLSYAATDPIFAAVTTLTLWIYKNDAGETPVVTINGSGATGAVTNSPVTTYGLYEYEYTVGGALTAFTVRSGGTSTSTRLGGVFVDGVRLMDGATHLTFASDKDLATFEAGLPTYTAVSQDSDYTPHTSEITAVSPLGTNPLDTSFPSGSVYDGNGGTVWTDFIANTAEWMTGNYSFYGNGTATFSYSGATPGDTLIFYFGNNTVDIDLGGNVSNPGTQTTVGSNTSPSSNTVYGAAAESFLKDSNNNKVAVSIVLSQASGAFTIAPSPSTLGYWYVFGRAPLASPLTLTLTDDKDLANFAAGDLVSQNGPSPGGTTATVQVTSTSYAYGSPDGNDITASGATLMTFLEAQPYWNGDLADPAKIEGSGNRGLYNTSETVSYTGANVGDKIGIIFSSAYAGSQPDYSAPVSGDVVETSLTVPMALSKGELPKNYLEVTTTNTSGTFTITGDAKIFIQFIGNIIPSGVVGTVDTTANTMTLSASQGTWSANTGNHVIGPAKTKGSGTISSVDVAAKTMTLSTSTGTWGANAGKYAIGEPQPSASVRLYTVHDAAGAVSDLQAADPGYVTMAGNSPYTLAFPAVFPTGNAPDVDLPAGTTLTTEVQATSTGSTPAVKTSNTITPS